MIGKRSRAVPRSGELRNCSILGLPALTLSGAQSGRERLAVPASQLAREPRLRHLCRYPRRRLRSLEQAHGAALRHRFHRIAPMGSYRSAVRPVGIMRPIRILIGGEGCARERLAGVIRPPNQATSFDPGSSQNGRIYSDSDCANALRSTLPLALRGKVSTEMIRLGTM